ncbi:hypothetical protein RHSIM_Rhsim10G0070100 [Rhododendron simsii]|uniref:Uncharacterized protein n=1 Tax=Rhododendron simsii TaxID=118357 RepID=A0A834LCL2_RHOSS|nr:hypothetical protein RHSIM_Rhsim10G0070100 [Rhododendron simsii]
MSIPSASNNSENGVTMPTTLAFLVSNFQSLVTIKLNAENFLLWKTQLLSCLTATLSSSTLPLVLRLDMHLMCGTVWRIVSILLSRSNLHELKRTLFNFTKTESMDKYIDDIKVCAQKLSAVGYEADDDDMDFQAINSLPEEEFSSLKPTLRTHRDLKFHELVSILKAEEHQSRKGKNNVEDGQQMPPSTGYQFGHQNIPMWRPMVSSSVQVPPQVSVPFISPSSSHLHFISPGTSPISSYGGVYQGQFYSTRSGPVGNAFQGQFPSALAACYTPGSPIMSDMPNTATAHSWVLDSRATNHVTSDPHTIQQPPNYTAGASVMVGNGQSYSSNSVQGAMP